jgi:hypothetical protein
MSILDRERICCDCRNEYRLSGLKRTSLDAPMSAYGRFCSLIPGLDVKLSAIVLAGPTVLSAVGTSPPHDGA